jgi:hypothetical protein
VAHLDHQICTEVDRLPDEIPHRARCATLRVYQTPRQLARSSRLRLNETHEGRGRSSSFGADGIWGLLGRPPTAPVSNAPVAAITSPSVLVTPVAFIGPAAQAPVPIPAPGPSAGLTPAKANAPDKPTGPDTKRKVEAALTAAAIAAIIVQASRDHAGGRCACPDDSMRNGRACGGRSVHTRPGGAALCYPSDVTGAMIESSRQRLASR